jgi:RHS repeat-associated protein
LTANNYLFAGEQFDPELGLYYNRARYLDVRAGRFWGMDSYEGSIADPASLHKYLYGENNPVNLLDASGNQADLDELAEEETVDIGLSSQTTLQLVGKAAPTIAKAVVVANEINISMQTLLLLSIGVIGLAVQKGDGNEKPQSHGGRLQVQGKDIEGQMYDLSTHRDFNYSDDTLSWPWRQSSPLLAYTACSKLSEFLQILTPTQAGRRGGAFARASRFIVNAAIAGGVWAPVSIPPFNANDPAYPDARVDIEVQSGQAFVAQ